jgi:hypothetical protein
LDRHRVIADNLAGEAHLAHQAGGMELLRFSGGRHVWLASAEHNPTGSAAGIAATAMEDIDACIFQRIDQSLAVLDLKRPKSINVQGWHGSLLCYAINSCRSASPVVFSIATQKQ